MKHQRNALRTGIFTILSIGLGAVVIVAIAGGAKSYDTYTVAFGLDQNIGGLRAGDDVRIGGWKVGSVRDIRVRLADPAGPAKLLVRIDVPTQYPLGRDAHVVVDKGITGSSSIDVENLGQGAKATDVVLDGHPDSFTGIIQKLGQIQPDLQQAVTSVRIATGRLPATEDRIDRDLDTADTMLKSVREFVGPGSSDFHAALANIHQITGDLRDRMPDLLDKARGLIVHVDGVVGHASSAMADVQATAANAKDATAALRTVLMDNKSKLAAIITSLKATSDNLKAASVEIRHSPWRLLYQPKPDEMANLNTYDSVRQFADGADSLDDAATALRDALADKNADPAEIKKLMARLDDCFAKFQAEQDKLWDEVKP